MSDGTTINIDIPKKLFKPRKYLWIWKEKFVTSAEKRKQLNRSQSIKIPKMVDRINVRVVRTNITGKALHYTEKGRGTKKENGDKGKQKKMLL